MSTSLAAEKSPARNETMDLLKFIAAIFVVFDHAIFPGRLGGWLVCRWLGPVYDRRLSKRRAE